MAGNSLDGFVQDMSSLGDRIIAFIVKYALVEFTVCAIIFLFVCVYFLIRWIKSRRDHQPDAEELPTSTNANFMVAPMNAVQRSTPVATGDGALDRDTLASMPTFVYSAKELTLEPCAICSKGFKDGEKGRLLRPCFHAFHLGCSDKWFRSHSTCSVCGSAVGALDV